jgi:hypothetical protein
MNTINMIVKCANVTFENSTVAAGLWHELSSPSQTGGSWFRILLKAWMSVCVCSVFVLSCVQVAALRRADYSSKEAYRQGQETEKAPRAQQKSCKARDT